MEHDTQLGVTQTTRESQPHKSVTRSIAGWLERPTDKATETVAKAEPDTEAKAATVPHPPPSLPLQSFARRTSAWLQNRKTQRMVQMDAKAKDRLHEDRFQKDTKERLRQIDTLLRSNKTKLAQLKDKKYKAASAPSVASERRQLEVEKEELKLQRRLLVDEMRAVKSTKAQDKVREIESLMEKRCSHEQQRDAEDRFAAARQRAEAEEQEADVARQDEEHLAQLKRHFEQLKLDKSRNKNPAQEEAGEHLADVKRPFAQMKVTESTATDETPAEETKYPAGEIGQVEVNEATGA